jgi:murein DD-endopeptidase MepM/ murein hydrolase activator NlpD
MRRGACGRRGDAVTGVLSLVLLLAACAPRVDGPAPVVSGEPAERGTVSVTVQRGQSLSEIAHTYHLPMRVIAEANGLSPPYRIQIGRALIIPGAAPPRVAVRPQSVAALPVTEPEDSPAPATGTEAPVAAASPRLPVVSAPLPPRPPPPSAAFAPAAEAVAPPQITPPTPEAPPAPSSPSAAPEQPASAGAAPPPARSGSIFLWPVRGRVLAPYGSKIDGTHNDGINIGAPKGAAVQAADAGVVAYTGNELRGYGNLILIKHPSGWISAYAHCDLILVKRGEKVARGQVVARVGSTGSVSEPQLHFELRRGNKPVDPREFLAPLPTAANPASRPS